MRLLAFVLFISIEVSSAAQTLYTGRVLDIETKKPLDSVEIVVKGEKVFSNAAGFFQVNADSTVRLVAKRKEYVADSFPLPQQNRFNFFLKRIETEAQKELAKSFYMFFNQKLRYPPDARQRSIQGIALIYFEVDSQSKVTKIEILNELKGGITDQLSSLLQHAPEVWYKIKQYDKFILPIVFQLSGLKPPKDLPLPTDKNALLLSEIVVVGYSSISR